MIEAVERGVRRYGTSDGRDFKNGKYAREEEWIDVDTPSALFAHVAGEL